MSNPPFTPEPDPDRDPGRGGDRDAGVDTGPPADSPVGREESTLRSRLVSRPGPALRWGLVAGVLLCLQLGAVAGGLLALADALVVGVTGLLDVAVGAVAPGVARDVVGVQQAVSGTLGGARAAAERVPTLLSRDVVPNQGYVGTDGAWHGTFLGLQPAVAWALRLGLVLAYAFVVAGWLVRGWFVFRAEYRRADWSPTDDVVDRFRGHRWGQFGLVVLVLFLTMALLGPAMAPSTVERNIEAPYSHQLQYLSAESGQVETVTVGAANFETKSKGSAEQNVGPMTYDQFGRFHPFGTLPNGRDLFTFMMGGARISLLVTGLAVGLSTLLAATLALISAFYRGSIDIGVLTVADGIVSIPQLLLLIMVSAVFADHWLGDVLDGGFLIGLIIGLTGWPFLWRAVRGPALQVAQEAWVDAAKSFGQRPSIVMRRHIFPYIVGYLLVYASMSAGGVVIGLSALSFLGNGLGISPPTPAWGRAVSLGQSYVAGPSWHISFVPGAMIVVLVTGLNAFGDGLRDAIDPESAGGGTDPAATGGGG
jgi:peptide/nickel transport system permease protein